MSRNNKFKLRAFVSLYMTFAFLIMTVSGIILYIAPPGRIANWSYWSILGLTKAEWQATHIIFTFVFVLATILHIIYNWKPLITYLVNKISGISSIRLELTIAIVFSLFLFGGTHYQIPPFVNVIDFGEGIKDSWSNESNEPPISHAERLTIPELATELKITTNQLIQKLKRNGYEISDSLETLEKIAEKYKVYPNEIYNSLVPKNTLENNGKTESQNSSYKHGSGYGRKKLSVIFSENNITWNEGVVLLKKKNIKVTEDANLKDIANENNLLPVDIINALKVEKNWTF